MQKCLCACVVVLALVSGIGVERYLIAQTSTDTVKETPKDNTRAGANGQQVEAPKDGSIYVWPLPTMGHQSLLILGVLDGNTVDAAYLVPVRVRIKGVNAPALTSKNGKDARAALEKLIGGQLRTAQLWGPDPQTGLVLADFWLPAEAEGGRGQWLSQALKK